MASIGFLILVHGRQVRQIKRLLLNIFRPEHTYFIYVASVSKNNTHFLILEIFIMVKQEYTDIVLCHSVIQFYKNGWNRKLPKNV